MVNVLSALEMNAYSNAQKNVLSWVKLVDILAKSSVFLLNFSTCSINYQEEVLKFPTIIVDLAISLLSSVSFCFLCFEILLAA